MQEFHETMQAAVNAARNEYLSQHIYSEITDEPGAFFGNAPRQFNVCIGENGFYAEFMEGEGDWIFGYCWLSGAEVTALFVGGDASTVDVSDYDELTSAEA